LDLNKEAGLFFIFQHKPLVIVAMKNRKGPRSEQTRKVFGANIFEKKNTTVIHNVQVFHGMIIINQIVLLKKETDVH